MSRKSGRGNDLSIHDPTSSKPFVHPERVARAEKAKEVGNKCFKRGEYEQAAFHYFLASKADETNAIYLANSALCYLKMEAYDEAEADAMLALRIDPRNFKARYRRALARKGLCHFRSARADFCVLLRIKPESEDAKRELALVEQLIESKNAGGKAGKDVGKAARSRTLDVNDASSDNDSNSSESDSDWSDCDPDENAPPEYINTQGKDVDVDSEQDGKQRTGRDESSTPK